MSYHLNLSLQNPGHVRTAWRLPANDPFAQTDVAYLRRLVQEAERAKIHAVFVGDGPALTGAIERAPEAGIEPVVLFASLLAGTSHIGAVATSSTTYNDPYNLARRYSALDHVTGGRAALNAVTTYSPAAAANFGLAEPPAKEDRYRRAEEFLEVITALWDAWEPGAIVADKASGRYADPSKVHAIDHAGEFFSVRGPLSIPESPQGRPLLVQAGASEGGVRLGARFADVVFAVAQTPERAVAFREDLRLRARAFGRDDGPIVSLGVVVLLGSTQEEARRRADDVLGTIDIDTATAQLLASLGLPPDSHRPDDPLTLADLPDVAERRSSEGFQASTRALLERGPRTPRDLVHRSAGGAGHRLVVGTPEQVADDLDAWYRAGAADGFTIMPADTATDLEAFTGHVVPLLQDRGSFQREYSGTTLRESYGLAPVRRREVART
ncbi:nitrilotriacetate monooxygenase [Cellulomonas chitinilytica]|uniref:Nitrilotriacetate monooxygenase n=1 Tax=Cellulomonas chitinilytica TaxID=398759 RepID=A0A919P1Z1_9CELL|nr:NtaA/DmoA family FMN-dependent monooxygenase [Cellulomonas chitinilytica]GIG19984.1 nitrilotriacetate monooxygenase [Cellulomonas chitinilytica]